jgi:hypothetical protein
MAKAFYDFSHSLQTTTETVPCNRPRPLPSTSFLIDSQIILPLDAVTSTVHVQIKINFIGISEQD